MKKRSSTLNKFFLIGGLGLTILSAAIAEDAKAPIKGAEKNATLDPEHPMHRGTVNFGVKTSGEYTDGSFSIVAPLWSSMGTENQLGGGYLFLEPYSSWGEQGEVATSLGLGFRYLFNDQALNVLTSHDGHQAGFLEEGVLIGANLFVDCLDTETNHQFWQFGFGAELATRYLELRANYYLPLTDAKEVERIRTRERTTKSSSSTSYSTQTSGADPFATGHTIQQDVTQTTYATTTTRTTTTDIERLFRRFEEGMEGWDAEVAVLVPGLDKYLDVKLNGGYYSYDNQPFGPQAGGTGNVQGWKAGIEVRPVPALALTATWYEDERLVGEEWLYGVRLEMPFEAGDIGDGKGGFWGRIKESFTPRRRHLAERAFEPVRRQNAAIKIAHSQKEDKPKVTSKTTVRRNTRVVAQSSSRLVLKEDIVFVDNAIGNDVNPGTYEAPVATVQGGETTAETKFAQNGTVFVQGGGGNYSGQVNVTSSMAFYGSGKGMTLSNGQVFQGRNSITPNLNGGFIASSIGAFTVSGFAMTGGVSAQNVGSSHIVFNSFSGNPASVINVLANGSNTSYALVSQNQINNAETGIVLISASGATLTVDVTGNVISNMSRDAIATTNMSGTSNLIFTASQNTIINAARDGFHLEQHSSGNQLATLTDNTVTNAGAHGVNTLNASTGLLDLDASNNTIENAGMNGFAFDSSSAAGTIDATLTRNRILTPGAHGIHATLNMGSMGLLASNNIIDTPGTDGISLSAANSTGFVAFLDGNQILTPTANGITMAATGTATLQATAQNNTISDVGGNGIQLTADNTFFVTAVFNGNTITNTFDDGINVEATGIAAINLTANGNALSSIGSDAIDMSTEDNSSLVAEINNNVITNTGVSGIVASVSDTSDIVLTANNNILTGISSVGIGFSTQGTGSGSTLNATAMNNQIQSDNVGFGMGAGTISTLTANLTGNSILEGANNGIFANSGQSGIINLTVSQNSIGLFDTNAITFAAGGGLFTANISNNTMTNNAATNAVRLQNIDTNVMNITFDGNTILGGGASSTGLDLIEGATATLNVNGTVNNVISPQGTLILDVNATTPAGTLLINNVPVVLPVNVP